MAVPDSSTFYYAIRSTFDSSSQAWSGFLAGSKLSHLTELISLDCMLNEDLVDMDSTNEDDWDYIVWDENITGFYTSIDFVMKKSMIKNKFNLLAVLIRPTQDCRFAAPDNYDFIGYELLDCEYDISAITNCGGFDETFSPSDLNRFGLIDDYYKACDIQKRLLENNPDEHHADTNVIAVWRHKTIGR